MMMVEILVENKVTWSKYFIIHLAIAVVYIQYENLHTSKVS